RGLELRLVLGEPDVPQRAERRPLALAAGLAPALLPDRGERAAAFLRQRGREEDAVPVLPRTLDRVGELRAHPQRRATLPLLLLEDLERAQHPRQALLARDAVAVELDVAVAHADSQVEPPAGPRVEIVRHDREAVRLLHRTEQHAGADAKPRGDREH